MSFKFGVCFVFFHPLNQIALKQAGEKKLLQIHTMKKKQKEELESIEVGEMLKRIRRNLQKETEMTTLIQNIFQVTHNFETT